MTKKALVAAIAMVILLRAWVSAERPAARFDMRLATSFDFSRYPACHANRNRYCIQAIRFYDAESNARLAEAPAREGMLGRQWMVAAVEVSSVPRRAYAVTVYRDGSGMIKEGPRGEVSRFDVASN